MKKLIGPITSVVTALICILVAEIGFKLLAPVPDPYERFKYNVRLNQYIKSELPVNFRLKTEPEEGLPGVHGPNYFSTNNMGFRGDYLEIPKPEAEFRIFLIGGSSTECLYLDDSESLNSILQNELTKRVPNNLAIKVYGVGKSGDASDDHVSMIAHRIVHLEPDMIILFSGINDLSRAIYNYDYLHYITRAPEAKHSPIKFLATEFQIARRFYYLFRRLSPTDKDVLEKITSMTQYQEKVRLRQIAPVSNEIPRTDLNAYANNLRTIIGISQAQDIQLLFMTQQTTWNSSVDPSAKKWHWMLYRNGITYREDYMDEALESLNGIIRQLSKKCQIPLFDLAKSMPKSLEFFYDDVHFNEKGAHTAAVELASIIVEKDLINSKR